MIKGQLNKGLLLVTGSLVAALGAQAAYLPNRVLVKYRAGESSRLMSERLASASIARELGALTHLSSLRGSSAVLRFSTRMDSLEAARALRADPDVEWAQPDYIMSLFPLSGAAEGQEHNPFMRILDALAADPALPAAPALPNPAVPDPQMAQTWGLTKIDAIGAWATTKGDRRIVVADIDTGIDYTHQDLVNNLWHNPRPTNGDVVGYDFVNNDPMPYDDQSHGTHTAGTIGATGGNGVGISGVSQAVSVMGIKFLSASGSGSTSDAVKSIDYAIAHGARIMSNSWGGPSEPGEENKMLEDAVARANEADILFVAAAGNDGSDNDTRPMYPAAIRSPNMLAVASTTSRDSRSFFSNYGKESVHVAAPGSNVYSTIPGNKYAQYSGTSMACPHVAGLAALILSVRPTLTSVQVKQIIMETVDPLPGLNGMIVTGGRVNAKAALERARNFGS